jgi:CrcB protein
MITGILGALTTYSTFAIESFFLLESGEYMHAFFNMTLNVFGTVLLAGIGYLFILNFTK